MPDVIEDRGGPKSGDHAYARSEHWPHVRNEFLRKPINASCAVCGGTEHLEVHHIIPFHICLEVERGYAELDPRNLITLCGAAARDCHLYVGHLGDFKSFNSKLRRRLHEAKELSTATIPQKWEAVAMWQYWHLHRPRPLNFYATNEERAAVQAMIDKLYPV